MTSVLARGVIMVGIAAAGVGLGSRPGLAHHDWGLPLIGGLAAGAAGGYALSKYVGSKDKDDGTAQPAERQPTYVQPAPVYAPPAQAAAPASATSTADSIESKLNVLDQLAAKGYITKSEYDARREALLNQL